MNKNHFGVIMAGGVGSRFWPLSTTKNPKQFHDILGTGRTFLQQTFDRLVKIIPTEQIYVVTLEEYADLTLKQLPELTAEQIISEPNGMNTAPSNLYASLLIHEKNPEANIVVAPSDHVILNETTFLDKLKYALDQSENNDILVTLGIKPTRPDTGYGYIQYLQEKGKEIKKVKTFTEKPGVELAEVLYQSGDFLWNAGIFIWRSKTILKAFQQFLPEMFDTFQTEESMADLRNNQEKIQQIYSMVQMISVDNGILEKADNVYVIPSSFGWSDLGTWKSMFEQSDKNDDNNVIKGKHILTYNTQNSLVYTTQKKAIIIDGLENYVVVDTKHALLICPMEKDQSLKTFVSDLKVNKGEAFT